MRSFRFCVVLTGAMAVWGTGCSTGDRPGPSATATGPDASREGEGGTAGDADASLQNDGGTTGSAAADGGGTAGSTGSDAATTPGTTGDDAAAWGDASSVPVTDEGCPAGLGACQGQCLAVGDTHEGCTRLWGHGRAVAIVDNSLFLATAGAMLRFDMHTWQEEEIAGSDDEHGSVDEMMASEGLVYWAAGDTLGVLDPQTHESKVLGRTGNWRDSPSRLQVVGDYLYFQIEDIAVYDVARLPLAGGEVEIVLEGADSATVSGDQLYHVEGVSIGSPFWPGGVLRRGTLPSLADDVDLGEGSEGTLFADGSYLYWDTPSAVKRMHAETLQVENTAGLSRTNFVSNQPGRAFYDYIGWHSRENDVRRSRMTRVVLGDAPDSSVIYEGAHGVEDALEHDGYLYIASSGGRLPSLGSGFFRLAL